VNIYSNLLDYMALKDQNSRQTQAKFMAICLF
jgi:hypothetical protein